MSKSSDFWIKERGVKTKKSYHGVPKDELRMVLVGKTGSGKSATGNTLLNWDGFVSDFNGRSVTKECKRHYVNAFDKKIVVVDTPGLSDTQNSSTETKSEIAKCLGITAPGPHIFLIVLRLKRQTNEEQKTVHDIKEIFGEKIYKYGIILFTGRNELEKHKTSLENYLATFPPSIKQELDKYQNGYIAIDNTAQDKTNERKMLLDKIQETVKVNGESYYTNTETEKAEAVLWRSMNDIMEKEYKVTEMKNKRKCQHKYQTDIADTMKEMNIEDTKARKDDEDDNESKHHIPDVKEDVSLRVCLSLTDEEKLDVKDNAIVTPENVRELLRQDCEEKGVILAKINDEVGCSIM